MNETGTIIGRLTKVEIEQLLVDVGNRELRRKLLGWFETVLKLEDKLGLVVSEPIQVVQA